MKIKEVEADLARKLSIPLKNLLHDLSYYLPEHYRVHVSMVSNGRKKRVMPKPVTGRRNPGKLRFGLSQHSKKMDS